MKLILTKYSSTSPDQTFKLRFNNDNNNNNNNSNNSNSNNNNNNNNSNKTTTHNTTHTPLSTRGKENKHKTSPNKAHH